MSFFDDASLVFLPSGQAGKDGKAYSMKPTNGDGDFTFSRGSNLTATRVDSNGLIEKGRENLFFQSNQFDTIWTAGNVSVTSGQSGYDGSSDAWKITSTNTGSAFARQNIVSSGVQTASVYAAKGNVDYIYFRIAGSTNQGAFINLSNGTIDGYLNQGNIIDISVNNVSGDWYRISITFNTTTSDIRFYASDSGGSSSAIGSYIYIQDAQLEQGLVATEYIESGASTGLAGILEDSPRFDYSGGASCPSLLLEPSRTQLIGESEYYENWDKNSGTTLTNNNAVSPDGSQNATLVESPLSGGRVGYNVALTSGTTYTFSVYLKNNGGNTSIDIGSHGTAQLETITIDNDWNRYSTTFTATSTTTSSIRFVSSGSNINMYAFGAQLEQGSYPTSYIPNHSGGSVTRDADVNTLLNQSGVIGQTEGTILFDAYFDEADKVNFSISDSTSSNYILIDTTSAKQVFARVQQGGSTQATITTTTSFFAEGDRLKCAIAYDSRDMAFYINGTEVGTADTLTIPACDDVRYGNYDGSIKAKQRVNRVLLFDTRISNGNLATLTS